MTRAKFSIMFPYFIAYNRLKPEASIKLSEEEMETKMKKFRQGLRRTREKDQERWTQEIIQKIEGRVDLHTLASLIQSGKQNKYDLPQNVKEQIDKATKLGKQLKKLISQSNKIPIERLLQKKCQVNSQKIITNEMNLFQSTVSRCIQWTKKAQKFENQFFECSNNQQFSQRKFKRRSQKIDFRDLSHLVEEYNSLPLLDDNFQSTRELYDETIDLLDKLPQFAKAVKTRNQNFSKINISQLRSLQRQIDNHPVKCDEFDYFKQQAQQARQFIEQISMLLEDDRAEKTAKNMSIFLKHANDNPIQSDLAKRLQSYIQYISLMEKIRKDILVYSKFEQTQENIKLAYKKGFITAELIDCQSKLDVFKNWFNTTQKLCGHNSYTKLDIVKKQNQIILNMIDEHLFRNQFKKAKQDLHIDESEVEYYTQRLQETEQQKKVVIALLEQKQPDLNILCNEVFKCIEQGLKYPQFLSLFVLVRMILINIADLSYVLDQHGFIDEDVLQKMFFTGDEYQQIVASIPGHRKQLKEITKTEAELMLQQTTIKPFPRFSIQWQTFKKFVDTCTQLQQRSRALITSYNRIQIFQCNSQTLFHDVEELQKQLKGHLVNESLIKQLSEIIQILRCRRIIDTKISLQIGQVWEKQDIQFIQKMRQNLDVVKEAVLPEKLKFQSLKFQSQNKKRFKEILLKMADITFQKPLKLSQINRIYKEIQRIQLDSIQLKTTKKELSVRFQNCERWRSKMLTIKNKKKPKKQEKSKQNEIDRKQEDIQIDIQDKQDIQKEEQNELFHFYFKFPLLIIKFYEGLKLKTNLQQLSRLKNFITQLGIFITKVDELQKNNKPQASEIADLNTEGNKWNSVFLLERWKLSRRTQFVTSWRNMAISILQSMPILRLEQRAIIHYPDQPIHNIGFNESIIQQDQDNHPDVGKQINQEKAEATGKRKRKQNSYYNNQQMTLFVDDLYPIKSKKKKKVEQITKRRTETKRSKKEQFVMQNYEPLQAVYCICRLGLMNEASVMLQCEVCQRWFHTECVGIRKSYIKAISEYYCPGCCKRYNFTPDFFKSFFWQSNKRMSQDNFRFLVNQGHDMNVILQQLSPLLTLEGRIDMWKNEVSKTVELFLELEEGGKLNQQQAQKTLFDLYLQSLWLPTVHLQSDILLTLLKKHESPQRVAQIKKKIALFFQTK